MNGALAIAGQSFVFCSHLNWQLSWATRPLRLDKFKMIADQRQEFRERVKELQPDVSNRAIAEALGVSHDTVNRDAGRFRPADAGNAQENREAGGRNPPNRTSFTGETEWYTPVEHLERARRVLGAIDLDPVSSAEGR
jgi:hypothetical protein